MVDLVASTLLQPMNPRVIVDLPGVFRAPVAFLVVLLFGAALLWRYDEIVERSIEPAIDRPLSSMGYGIATHFTIVFFGVYAASQLSQLSVAGRILPDIGIWIGVFLLGLIAAIGFTVIGTAAIEIGWEHHQWYGLLVGATLAGLAALVDPLVGGLVWIVIVSTGIGGRVRVWLHAAEDTDAVD